MPRKTWKTLSSKVVYRNPWYFVRQDRVIRPDGTRGTYDVVVSPDSVFIVALDDRGRVLLIGQQRYTTRMYSMEVPGGGSSGQPPLPAAKRELQEETGYVAKRWRKLGAFQSTNGMLCEIAHVYLAQGLRQTAHHEQAEEGIDQMRWVSLPTALRMIRRGQITDGQSMSALALAALVLGNIRSSAHEQH